MSGSILANAADGLIAAAITAGSSWLIYLATNKRREARRQDAWQEQADELDKRLTQQYEQERDRMSTQYENQIAYFKGALGKCQSETQRLQKLVGKLQSKGRGDD